MARTCDRDILKWWEKAKGRNTQIRFWVQTELI